MISDMMSLITEKGGSRTDSERILTDTGLTETELIFKENVRKLRKKTGRTIVETAEDLGLKYGKDCLIESMTPVNVKFETMERISNHYGIPVSDLFKL